MTQIDLDDLPPRVAQILASLSAEGELTLVRDGVVVARLRVSETLPPADQTPPSEAEMKEVMEQFNAMIHDEF